MYTQWKQRLYAFLLRRVLGPYLSAASLKKLHESIEVSLQEGKFALKDVDLNAGYLTALFAKRGHAATVARRARIRKLEIHLTLEETHHESATSASGKQKPTSTVAWRAMQLGRGADADHGVKIIAHIEIEGFDIELEPGNDHVTPTYSGPPRPNPTAAPASVKISSTTAGMIASYVDAAMCSLQLSLQIKDLCVKLCSTTSRKSTPLNEWVELSLATARYHDVDDQVNEPGAADLRTTTSYKTVLHKAIDFSGIAFRTGKEAERSGNEGDESSPSAKTCVIAKTEGSGNVSLRVIEYFGSGSSVSSECDMLTPPRVQQDLEVSLNQRLNFSVDHESLQCLVAVSSSFLERKVGSNTMELAAAIDSSSSISEQTSASDNGDGDTLDTDDADWNAMAGIVKQYAEARMLAERNEVRGGILLPSKAFEDGMNDEDSTSFDAFFDANDHSFSLYKSRLEQSIMASHTEDEETSDFVHTKVRFHLQQCGAKVTFPRSSDDSTKSRLRVADEYVLITLGDISISSSLSHTVTDLSLDLVHCEIEDSMRDRSITASQRDFPPPLEIGNVLRFVKGVDDALDSGECLVTEAPCISMNFVMKRDSATTSTCSLDLILEPTEVIARSATVSNLFRLMSSLDFNKLSHGDVEIAGRASQKLWCLSASCPSFSLVVPLGHDPLERLRYEDLFDRCGYLVPTIPISRGASIGLKLDAVSVSHDSINSSSTYDGTPKRANAPTTVSCQRMLVFVVSPRTNSSNSVACMQRADIIASSGHAPITLTQSKIDFENEPSVARAAFPTVPPLSSFKARQEDEDSDNEGISFNKLVSPAKGSSTSAARAADTQDVLLGVAERCSTFFDLYLPDLTGDVTRDEAIWLLDMVISEISHGSEATVSNSLGVTTPYVCNTMPTVGFAVSVEQMTLTVHQKLVEDTKVGRWFSYVIMAEACKAFAALNLSHLQALRVMAHELNFFEVRDLVNTGRVDITSSHFSTRDRCDDVRRRALQRGSSIATPILYRSQLFSPLSPESPSFLADCFTSDRRTVGDEWNVYLTIYSMTHRLDVDSQWLNRLQKLSHLPKFADRNKESMPASEDERLPAPEVDSQLVKLFVSLADCNIDYSTPETFTTESRMIIRLGDLRLSSNLVSPRGPTQAFKTSLGDLTILLCNRRYSHKFENTRLARASIVLCEQDLMRSSKSLTPDVVLRDMNLITMLSLDSMDMGLSLSSRNEKCHDGRADPLATVDISVGIVNLYGCKDSFGCFAGALGELQSYVSALDEDAMRALEEKNVVPGPDGESPAEASSCSRTVYAMDHGAAHYESRVPRPISTQLATAVESMEGVADSRFLVGDGISVGDAEDWATVEHAWSTADSVPPAQEQSARWYSPTETVKVSSLNPQESETAPRLRIIPNHIPLASLGDPSRHDDMNASKFAGTASAPAVQARIIVHDVKQFKCRFFDGYDWPKSKKWSRQTMGDFVIDSIRMGAEKAELKQHLEKRLDDSQANEMLEKKAKLLGDLLADEAEAGEGTFRDVPLAEERGEILEDLAVQRRLARRINKFFQVSLSGFKMRIDTFAELYDHSLASILDLKIADLFLAETISNARPVKLLGEWFNEVAHPRDTNDGLIMLKMVTWHPKLRVTVDGEIGNDESQLVLKMLPLRCNVDQRAIQFAVAFFASKKEENNGEASAGHEWAVGLKEIPPPLFQSFKVKSCKLKVNYTPEKVDVEALRQGSYVELINISPLVDMVILLQPVQMQGHVGFGSNVKEMAGRWIEDICATQLHKFLANAKPFQPFTSVGARAGDLFVLPWEAYRNGEPVGRAARRGTASFAGALAYETLNTGAQISGYAAQLLSTASSPQRQSGDGTSPLPSRPKDVPRGIRETANHALESLARGLETANYKIVIVPYREYRKSGTTGAVRSVVRGIPVAIAAPVGGATEALSYAMLGARNQVRPDIRKEEEANERGLKHDF